MTTYQRTKTNFLYGDKHQFKVFNNDGDISEAFKKRVRSPRTLAT